jgi:hypothetical protein
LKNSGPIIQTAIYSDILPLSDDYLEMKFGQFSLNFTFNTVTKYFVIVLVGYFDNIIEIDKDPNVKRVKSLT